MLLNARKVFYHGDLNTTLLLAIEDITDRRVAERLLHSLSEQKDMLLSEMSHRVANSLQIIASILLLKARSVQSEETGISGISANHVGCSLQQHQGNGHG
jgi:chemotaxis protein methyltransferase CheR